VTTDHPGDRWRRSVPGQALAETVEQDRRQQQPGRARAGARHPSV